MPDSRAPVRLGPVGVVYGIYTWAAFAVCALFAVLFTLLVPGLERRRTMVTICARLPFRLAAIPVDVRGFAKIPPGACVVVANHASYIDGVLLQAFLPPRFSYVIKGEVQNVPVMGFLLRRIGSRFVERFDASGSARDARQLMKAAQSGDSLAFFPEGTFNAEPGLGKFRAGAFAAAINAGVPVVPVVISGSRTVLPATRILPRHSSLGIEILDPIEPSDEAYSSSRTLSALARRRILAVLDEPDLQAGRGD
ncbi:MAG: 1-acyl-sn-glycerol-3-phosphate acyltransferase [Gammaproteobacteria bacterium]|nr:1-acyl-sn-glycerol-3-phosphate acyltransferase [Gammaproteobacteria bacterium]